MKERRTSVKINMICRGLHAQGKYLDAQTLLSINVWVKGVEAQLDAVTKQRDECKAKLQEIATEAESFCGRTGKSVTWLNEVKELLEK